MATTAVTSSWVRPSDFFKDASSFLNTGDGVSDTLDAVTNIADWLSHLGFWSKAADATSHALNPVGQALAIPAFFGNLGALRTSYQKAAYTDDAGALVGVWNHSMLIGVHGAKSLKALDSWGIVDSLKKSMRAINTVFWTGLLGLTAMGLYCEVGEVAHLKETIGKKGDDLKLKAIYEHKLQNAYLKVLEEAVVAVAMAPLCLISLLFAGIAHGILFHPAVMLSLTTAWCALHFTTYFYEKAINRWEADYNSLKDSKKV